MKFNFDSKVFILTLKDAYMSSNEINKIKSNRKILQIYLNKFYNLSISNDILLINQNEFIEKRFLFKIISCKTKDSLYILLIFKESINFYFNFISKTDFCKNFTQLDTYLKKLENSLINELKITNTN